MACQALTGPAAPKSTSTETASSTPVQAQTQRSATSSSAAPSLTASSEPIALPITETPTPTSLRFAVIGDFGMGDQHEGQVSELVKSWNPDLIITTGDNNYPDGAAQTIDQNIGQYYHQFIYPYQGIYGSGADRNRFFPTLGNHDYNTEMAQPYLDYFTLPGNERYYDFTWEPVHFFAVDSDSRTPDGVSAGSVQAFWLKDRLESSVLPWKIVYFHTPPYSSGPHGPTDWMRWPFQEWGATTVLSGHNHIYERLLVDGFPYFVNGVGGGPIYEIGLVSAGSQVQYNSSWGAMLVDADPTQITFQFINIQGELIDIYQIVR